jgi:biopolymer transport protein ExbD
MKKKRAGMSDKIEINMTPMIDVVFQLLTFFLFSIKAVDSEGNFSVKMPTPSNNPIPDIKEEALPKALKLSANADGFLTQVGFEGSSYPVEVPSLVDLNRKQIDAAMTNAAKGAFEKIHQKVLALSGPTGAKGKDFEIELDCSPQLKYHYIIQAIDAVSGHYDPASDTIVPLIEKIKFKPR